MYSAECDGPKFYKTLMFFGQTGMFLSFQAGRSSATRSSTSDLTVFWKCFGVQRHQQSESKGYPVPGYGLNTNQNFVTNRKFIWLDLSVPSSSWGVCDSSVSAKASLSIPFLPFPSTFHFKLLKEFENMSLTLPVTERLT